MNFAMYATVLRLGLWTLILVLALYVLTTTYADQEWVEMIPLPMLQQALVVALVLIGAGVVLRFVGVGARVVAKNRCQICKTPIPPGAIYCRQHLRRILHVEDAKAHQTRIR
jgi:predicted nucleic acid-binding Zn ribbon protein